MEALSVAVLISVSNNISSDKIEFHNDFPLILLAHVSLKQDLFKLNIISLQHLSDIHLRLHGANFPDTH